MPSTTAASRKYNEKAYDRLYVTVPKGKKEEIRAHVALYGGSVNGFIGQAIDEKIMRDIEKEQPKKAHQD